MVKNFPLSGRKEKATNPNNYDLKLEYFHQKSLP
jgi:hypothetical protein